MANVTGENTLRRYGGELARRVALARQPLEEQVSSPPLRRLAAELSYLAEPVRRQFRTIDVAKSDRPTRVMLLPGFATHPLRLKYLARQLERAGHTVKRWGLGFNWGATQERFDMVERHLLRMHHRMGEPIVLIGWSLGGLFARELAKRHPYAVAKVITMGTPFSGSMRANNAWRAYQAIAGYSVDDPPVQRHLALKPPVPTIAFWSPRDGVISPRCACGRPDERDRAIALRCSHIGFVFSKESIEALLRELERD